MKLVPQHFIGYYRVMAEGQQEGLLLYCKGSGAILYPVLCSHPFHGQTFRSVF